MADNIFDKLDEQSEILARIDKNTASESSAVEEMIRTNDPRMIEFVKTADRVFVYTGDKSELNRQNKKCRILCIKKMILALIQIATVLSAIYVPYMWCVLINRGVFSGCKSLEKIDFNGVTYIDKSSFTNCIGLTEIAIPDSVTYIGEWAFAYCSNLKKVSVGKKTFIDKNAFNECPAIIERRSI